ncbi:uncharacterized protein LOC106168907 [Lingula anatina]|uniref:Uncharacterized protein LOC106168907 n=1 Tax=Lingula anatina TaxID=7574 RepID=A0A1S3J033_LINAN|nr:uncharacterized protein LOC106168907 [Lingula anatina]|eukprot:XP_013403618.1 uncharacterized protein LOC106168907 [Lingula anatina]
MAVRFCEVILICLLFVAFLPKTGQSYERSALWDSITKGVRIENIQIGCELHLGYTLPSSGDYLHPIREENFEEYIRLARLVPEMKVYSCDCCPMDRVSSCRICVEH